MSREKAQREGATTSVSSSDWFGKATQPNVSLGDGLDLVQNMLSQRQLFIAALRENLCGAGDAEPSSIHALSRQVKQLDDSLQFRLGLLRPEREAAWFRPAASEAWGPFQSSMLRESVLPQYAAQDFKKLKNFIKCAWRDRLPLTATFLQAKHSLLHLLLEANAQWQRIAQLPSPFSSMNLAAEEISWPDELWSPLLVEYVAKVRMALLEVRSQLDRIFSDLCLRCEQLWSHQEQLIEQQDAIRRQKSRNDHARHWREEFKQRRQGATMKSSAAKYRAALKCLGFDKEPDPEELRSRYRQLAKRWHPDLNNGDDTVFKDVSAAYRLIQHHVGR